VVLKPPKLVKVKAHVLLSILRRALRAYPHECCGVLLGRAGEVAVVEEETPLRNLYEGEPGRFWFSDEEWVRALKLAKIKGRDYVGLYHSHPDGSALPSLSDRHRMLAIPSEVWLIVAVTRQAVTGYMAWRIDDAGSSIVRLPVEVVWC